MIIAAGVVVSRGRLLLVRRRVQEGSLSWQLPAGKTEQSETSAAAAVREAAEEAGVEVRAGRVLGERVHPGTGRHMVYVACDLIGGTARVAAPTEVDAVAWASSAELKDYVPDGFAPVVEAYLAEHGLLFT